MPYSIDGFYPDQRGGGQRVHNYTTIDVMSLVVAANYFDSLDSIVLVGNKIAVFSDSDGNGAWFMVTVTAVSTGSVTVVADLAQELLVTGAVQPGAQSVELNHISVVIAATIVTSLAHQGLFIAKDTSASGTEAHTLTLTAGTFDGSGNIATFNAPNEAIAIWFDSAGDGTILENVGSVVIS